MPLERREGNVYKFTVHFFTVITSLTHVFISMTIFLRMTRTNMNMLKEVIISLTNFLGMTRTTVIMMKDITICSINITLPH